MNLPLNKILVLLFLCSIYGFGATLTGAYNAFQASSYEQSLIDYRTVYETTNSRDALYGMINSLVALSRYEEAQLLCKIDDDPILLAKAGWIYGLDNDRKRAESFLENIRRNRSDSSNAVIYRSTGFGFYEAGNYRQAIKWYDSANTFVTEPLTNELLEQAVQAKKSSVIWSGTALGGPVIYSQNEIDIMGANYTYDRGTFFDISSHWSINKNRSVEVSYARFDATFQDRFEDFFYGINYESNLYYSLDSDAQWPWQTQYSVNDSITAWQNSNSDINKYSETVLNPIRDSINGTIYAEDTVYTLYEEHYLGTSDTGTYDTIARITSDSEVQSDPVYQNNFYLGYTSKFSRGKNFHWGAAANLFTSNINGVNNGVTLYGYHGHPLRNILLNGNWYTITSDKVTMVQGSPEFIGYLGKLSLRVTPSYVWKGAAPDQFNIPGVQLSCETELKYYSDHISIGGAATVGKRAFASESAGKHTVTITLPHKFTGSFSFAVSPGDKHVTVFSIFRYENYEQMSRLIALGGITVSI